jgi:TolB-like protein
MPDFPRTALRIAGEGAERQRREAGEGSPPLALPDKPSIAVLPFANMSGDPEQEYFADGMVEEIITALSRVRWLFVIARNSTFTYKGRAVDVKQVGRELGVRYVLEGSVRKAGHQVRITAQLIDTTNGAHLWADRFDGSLDEVFDLQDKVAISVAGVIEPALQAAEIARSANRPTNDLTAYDLCLRALANHPWLAKEQLLQARDLLERAIARDPRYGPLLLGPAYATFDFGLMAGREILRLAAAKRSLWRSKLWPSPTTMPAFSPTPRLSLVCPVRTPTLPSP